MNKYSQQEASEMIGEVNKQISTTPSYRFGQGLYNLMDEHMSDNAIKVEGHAQWYNSKDKDFCITYFYENFVV